MARSNKSVLAFHWTKFKSDAPIILGATVAITVVLATLIVLHDQSRSLPTVAAGVLGVAAFLALLTISMREFMRRTGRLESGHLFHARGCFAVAFVGGLLLTGLVAQDELESGVAFYSGRAQLDNKDYAQARASFDKYIAIYPKKPAGYYYRALAQFRQGQLDLAYRDLQVAVDLQPRDWDSQVLLLGTLQNLGRTAEFETQLKVAEQINPNAREAVEKLNNSRES